MITIEQGGELLKNGGVIVFPTDTVYGIGASIEHPKAVEKIFEIKKREGSKSLPVQISSFDELYQIAEIPSKIIPIIPLFFPGPFTLVFQKKPSISDLITGGKSTVGVRMPDSEVSTGLVVQSGAPIVLTSANLSGQKELKSSQEIIHTFGPSIDGVVGGKILPGKPSTVIDLSGDVVRILRYGAVSKETLSKIISFQDLQKCLQKS